MELSSSEFSKGLSQHGYGFQYAVVGQLYDLMGHDQMDRREISTELAVGYMGMDTRIDILMKVRHMSHTQFNVIECKRVNPKFGHWCFAKVSRPCPEYTSGQMAIESVHSKKRDPVGHEIEIRGDKSTINCYHLGFVMQRNNAEGDAQPVSHDRDAIEAACGQVCLGAVGLTQALIGKQYLLNSNVDAFYVLPVIVTTAKLFTTCAKLSSASLSTGDITLRDNDVEGAPWIIYQYMLSPGRVLGEERVYERSADIINNMYGDSARSVVIINADHLGEFWKWYDNRK